MGHYGYLAKVEEDKIKDNHTKMSFDMKGSIPKGIVIGLLYATYSSHSEAIEYIINNETIKTPISQNTTSTYEGGINTNNKWIKVNLDIKNLPPVTKNKRNAFGIKLYDGNNNLDLYIDNITIE